MTGKGEDSNGQGPVCKTSHLPACDFTYREVPSRIWRVFVVVYARTFTLLSARAAPAVLATGCAVRGSELSVASGQTPEGGSEVSHGE